MEEEKLGYFHYDEKYTGKLIKMEPVVITENMKSPDELQIIITIPPTLGVYEKKIEACIPLCVGDR